ncbi:gliding motility-associated C-terminal domain-containing protein [Mucilaginibacter xinganensis]|uniref:Ig-like domain-containing protein n=1 Tax=Mucilaginibacter xinganensis TaxID=1234841 RepID=A0A223NTG6_9SPHI|nr:gliding motility-associated C-terminal domain-containing protein [Mucilaginibacter xinganensis]ASU33060.1 hypothetical protein MuYL_1160 [Mucilaginibacter xinganensis]
MINRSTHYLVLLVLLLSVNFCGGAALIKPLRTDKNNNRERLIKKRAAGHITAFKVPGQLAPEIIDEANHSISLVVHASTNRSALTPTITLDQGGSTVTPNSGAPNDFTIAQGYVVDGSTFYSVNVLPTRALAPICAGTSTTVPGDPPPGIPVISYAWEILDATNNWVPAPGPNSITSSDYQTPVLAGNPNSPMLYTYRRGIITAFGTAYDSYTDVTVNPSTPISNNNITAPGTSTFCASGQATTITGSAPLGGLSTYTYQWQSSTDGSTFTDIAGATIATFDPPLLNTTTWYRRMVTSGTCTAPSTSNLVKITIQPALSNNTITPPATVLFCATGSPAVIAGTLPTGGDGINYTYQWQSSLDGGSTFNNIINSDVKDYNPGTIAATTLYRRTVISGTCSTPSVSNSITITVQTALSNNTVTPPANITFCATGSPGVITGTLPAGGDGINYTYQWQSSLNGGSTFNNILNSNVKDYNPGVVTTTTLYRRTVISGSCTTPSVSNSVKISVQPALSNNTITPPATVLFCATGSPGAIAGTLPTGGDAINYTYQWQSSLDGGSTFNNILNSNVKDYNPGVVTATTAYRRTVISGNCTIPSISNSVTITVQSAPSNNTITPPPTVLFCATGSPGLITGSLPTGGDGIAYIYQWQSSLDGGNTFNNILNSNGKDYDPGVVTATTAYRRTVISGACAAPSISNSVTITVYKVLSNNLLTAPATAAFCGPGDPAAITGSLPTGGDGAYTYKWQQSTDNTSFTDIAGAVAKDYDPALLTVTTYYRRLVISGTCITPVISNVIEIHITNPLTVNTIGSPLTTTFCTSVDPAVIPGGFPAVGDGPNTFIYQWQRSLDGTTWTDIPGANSIDYDSPPIMVTTSLRRNVTSGACMVPLSSNVVKFTIIDSPPNITTNPVAPICAGNKAVISVTSPSAALTYFWYNSPTKDFILFTGPVYTTDPLTASQTFYVEASNGTCNSPILASAAVTVIQLPSVPAIVTSPVTTCMGSVAAIDIANPQAGQTYNWYTTATGVTPIFTGSSFTTPPVTANITYYAEAVNSSGCASSSRTPVPVSAIALPVITAHGASVCPGETATLTIDRPDPDVIINWYTTATGGIPIFTGSSFPAPPANANITYFAEAVSGGCISASRAAAMVQIIKPLPAPIVSVESALAPTITFKWNAVTGAAGYEVSLNGGQSFTDPSSGSGGTTHTVQGLSIGQTVTIVVRATGDYPCQLSNNSIQVSATAINPLIDQIFVANAFTPNGDGKNDIIYVHNENIKTLKFYVYDQWGELLYVSQSQQNGWDGTFKGKTEPAGVYVYYLEAIMNDGQLVKKKGTITLLR